MGRTHAQHGKKGTFLDKPLSFRDTLKKRLSTSEQAHAIYSFDVLGNLALIEIPKLLSKKRSLIGKTLLETNPRIHKVFEKVGEHEGKYRVEKIKWIAGEKNPETLHTEWGCVFRVNSGIVFFNPRLSTDRQRTASYVKKGQNVVVFFGGIGPYAIEIAKHAQPGHVTTIEWNPSAKMFLADNIARNRLQNIVEPLFGDIRKISPRPEFDHIIMPAPENAVSFLPLALKWLSKKGGLIHCYLFVSNLNTEKEAAETISSALGKRVHWKISFVRKVNDYSSRKRQVCVGITVKFKKSNHAQHA
jgi:tRNA (guanine37-N1)-methyltransferase